MLFNDALPLTALAHQGRCIKVSGVLRVNPLRLVDCPRRTSFRESLASSSRHGPLGVHSILGACRCSSHPDDLRRCISDGASGFTQRCRAISSFCGRSPSTSRAFEASARGLASGAGCSRWRYPGQSVSVRHRRDLIECRHRCSQRWARVRPGRRGIGAQRPSAWRLESPRSPMVGRIRRS